MSDRIEELRRTLEGVIGVPATEGNQLDVLRNGDEIFPAMLDAISDAEHTIDLLTFVYWKGEIGTEFARGSRNARRPAYACGCCSTRGARTPWSAQVIDDMDRAGVQVRWFRPLRRFRAGTVNHRTHRKVMVVDESVGFTGGVGIADEWRGDARNATEWRDTHFRIRGPAVDGLRAAFLDNWVETDPVLFDERVDRFPDQPKPGETLRAMRARCLGGRIERRRDAVPHAAPERAQLRSHHDRVLRSGRGPHGATVRRGRAGTCRCRSCCPVRTPTSASCSSRAKRCIPSCSTPASSSGTSNRR